ncbi:MAG: hypothetical protein A2V81_00145 [Candidatus Abawacabacteria bacterium RBG_16_42_10]|uniref:DUF11 domain-containing protein n=1 Tax=Candidatus Abawacabacteria bacterium RBG_16_42_10 TaxID=1817814 RepID=A0A1F4XL71_9BACT|nr:MAG: hypothetical protein A2V81_00145 [Candidatus Abawacabacteria bacterium RBG_16_42_10]
MSVLQKILAFFRPRKVALVRIVAAFCVLGLLLNFVPELASSLPSLADDEVSVVAQAPSSIPANAIVVGNSTSDSVFTDTNCNKDGVNDASDNNCDLGDALALANLGPVSPDTIVFRNSTNDIDVTTNLPAITDSVTIDGENPPNTPGLKTVLKDSNFGSTTLDYFFYISPQDPIEVTIKNIAFTALKKLSPTYAAPAITTDDPSTPLTREGALINRLIIEDNFFGTVDGKTPSNANQVQQGITVFIDNSLQPNVSIHNNNFFNIGVGGINIGSFDSNGCSGFLFPNSLDISNNEIGVSVDFSDNDSNYMGGEEWGQFSSGFGGFGILTCNTRGGIHDNIIGNSRSNTFNFGIWNKDSQLDIHDNHIGTFQRSDASFVSNMEMTGWGITLQGNYFLNSIPLGSRVFNNHIFDIQGFTQSGNTFCSPVLFSGNGIGDRACGGTGIAVNGSNKNLIYDNVIGSKDFENEGYGIQIEGFVSGAEKLNFLASTHNKIFNNTISYNKADGIVIPAISNLTDPHNVAANDIDCGTTEEFTNNCFNTINQNKIFRNGRYNDAPVSGQFYNGGGIGIDLKSGSGAVALFVDNYREQKQGTNAVTTGTTNDKDITKNDIGDTDFGGNDLMNYANISPADDPTTSSTADQINGNISGSGEGFFWVEVFKVLCDAESDSDDVVQTDALPAGAATPSQCDADKTSEQSIAGGTTIMTHGQGYEFLCGALAEGPGGLWSCRPEDFDVDFTGGLITATATKLEERVNNTSGISIVPNVSLKYSCDLAGHVFLDGAPACAGANAGTTDYTNLGGLEANLIQALGSTSEFSQDVFIPQPNLEIIKQVRGCTGPNASDCNASTFGENVTVAPGSTVEFRLDVINRGTGSSTVTVNDPQPSGLVFSTCSSYNNQDVLTDTGERPATVDGGCIFISLSQGIRQTVIVPPGKHLYLYFLATVGTSVTGTLTNVARIEDQAPASPAFSRICPPTSPDPQCSDDATVTILPPPQDGTLVKEIITPNTDADTSKETVPSPTSATDVNYKITLTLRGVDSSSIANLDLTDTFQKVIKTGTNITYTKCQFTMQVNSGSPTALTSCPSTASDIAIATTPDHTPLIIWSGEATGALVFTPADTLIVVVTYKGIIPANPLLPTDAAKLIENTTSWGIPDTPSFQIDSTDLTITPPVQVPTVTIRHRFDTASGPSTASVTSSSSSTVSKDYFITVDVANTGSGGLANFKLSNNFVTTGTNFTGNMTYDTCSISYAPSTPAGFPTTCPGTLSGNVDLISGLTLPANITTITARYRGTVPANAVIAPNVATIVNRATVDAPSLTSGVSAAASASADATLIINGNEAGTPSLTLDKRADNNVSGTDRSDEKVYSPGETVNYTVTITNGGNGIASGATLRDTLERNLENPSTQTLPSPATGGFSGNSLNVTNITVPASGNITIGYRGTLADDADFDLDNFDMDSTADPKKDEDFYAPSDADIDENIDTRNNRHSREDDLLDIPDGKFVSLGDGGEIIIDLGKKVIVDGSDGDFGILELDHNADDTDQSTESYTVYVSQDGNSFERVERDVADSGQFDIGDANLSWARFIKLEDSSSTVKANAPGADIDAICLFNIGVRLPNKTELNFNGQILTDSEYVTVDVTDVFEDSVEKTDCEEKTPAPIPTPPQPPRVVTPPPMLPKTGPLDTAVPLVTMGILGAMAWVMRRKNQ